MSQKQVIDLAIYKFIDAYVDLNGSINIHVLTEHFHVHRSRASELIKGYLEVKPSNLRYSLSERTYLKGLSFERVYLTDLSSFEYWTAILTVFGDPKDQHVKS